MDLPKCVLKKRRRNSHCSQQITSIVSTESQQQAVIIYFHMACLEIIALLRNCDTSFVIIPVQDYEYY